MTRLEAILAIAFATSVTMLWAPIPALDWRLRIIIAFAILWCACWYVLKKAWPKDPE